MTNLGISSTYLSSSNYYHKMSGTCTKTYSRPISILEIYNNSSGNPFSYIIAIRGIGYKGGVYL